MIKLTNASYLNVDTIHYINIVEYFSCKYYFTKLLAIEKLTKKQSILYYMRTSIKISSGLNVLSYINIDDDENMFKVDLFKVLYNFPAASIETI